MKWKQRPSVRELEIKLSEAKTCLAQKKFQFGPNVEKLVDDFIALKIDNAGEIWPLVQELLPEIKSEHYAGTHPPMRAIESNLNCELFIFVWESKRMKQRMHLKFAIKDDCFYYFFSA